VFCGNTEQSNEGRKDELQRWKKKTAKRGGDIGTKGMKIEHKINYTR